MSGDVYEHMGEDTEAVEVVDRATAEQAARWLSREARKADVECRPIKAEIERLQALLDERQQIADNKMEPHLLTLETWHRANPGAAKTERFPYGTAALRARPVKVTADDNFLEWAVKDAPEFVTVTVKVNEKALRNACAESIKGESFIPVTDDGELLVGVTLERPDPSWSFKPAEPLTAADDSGVAA